MRSHLRRDTSRMWVLTLPLDNNNSVDHRVLPMRHLSVWHSVPGSGMISWFPRP
jgi:hypothetical protein